MFQGVGQYPGNFVDYEKPELTMFFTDGFDTAAVKNSFELIDKSGKQIPIKLNFTDDATVKLISEKKLKPKNQFQVKINLKNFIDAAGNSVDSIYTYKFDTINDLDFSGVSGKVKQPGGEIPVTVILQNAANKTNYYSQKINAEGLFNFNKVIPDKYLLWTYIDSDSSGNYSYGQIKPFEYSEKFVFYPNTLKLIPRWPVGDIIINFDK
jgi:hypothetical protein